MTQTRTLPFRPLRRLGRRGATAAEFALVAIPATLMMYGIMEVSWQLVTLGALDQATLRAARFGVLGADRSGRAGAPECRSEGIPWFAKQVSGGLLSRGTLTVTLTTFNNYNSSTSGSGGTSGAGAGGQVVTYTLSYTQPWLVGGLVKLVSGESGMTFRSSLTVKNEPFDNDVC